MKYKFITIEQDRGETHPVPKGKPIYRVNNRRTGDCLGGIAYYPNWRCYVFWPESKRCIFNAECLDNIKGFIENEAGKG